MSAAGISGLEKKFGCMRQSSSRMSRKTAVDADGIDAGFTMIELALVMLLIGVLAVVAVPRLSMTPPRAIAEAEMLRANLRFAQAQAMANNTSEWSVQIGANSYQLLRNGASSPVHFPGEDGPVHNLAGSVSVTSGAGTLELNDMGAPATTHLITLSDGTRTETVTMTGFTGLVP